MNRGWLDRLAPAIMFALVAIAVCVLVFPWRLRLDSQGIARRRLWKWDLWPWVAFQDGTVRKGRGAYRYEWPERRLWSRTVCYDALAKRDRDFVHEVCNRFWVPPPEPVVPEELVLKVPFRRQLRLTAEGIYCRGYGPTPSYRWDQLERAVVVRLEHVRRDLAQAEIVAGGRTITLRLHQGTPLWKGPEPEVIVAWLRHHVPADRLLIVATHNRPRSLAEIEYREDAARRGLRDFARMERMVLSMFGVYMASCFLLFHPLQACLMVLLGAIPLVPIWLFGGREVRKRIRRQQDELERSRAEITGEPS
jgi:hypothetical protein